MDLTGKTDARTLFLLHVTGRLSIPAREEMESRLMADQEFSDMMAVCEQELIDDYATGSCTAEEAEQLGPWIQGSEMRMQRLAIARSFLNRRKRIAPPLKAEIVFLALAACVLLAAGLVVNRSQWIKRSAPPQNVSQSAPAADKGQHELPPSRNADVILLIAEQIRGPQEPIPTFFVNPDRAVTLEILVATEPRSQYHLRVVREGSNPWNIFDKADLEPHSADHQTYLSTTLSPGSIPAGTYKAALVQGGETQIMRFAVNWVKRESPGR